jgi:hypothetical protein
MPPAGQPTAPEQEGQRHRLRRPAGPAHVRPARRFGQDVGTGVQAHGPAGAAQQGECLEHVEVALGAVHGGSVVCLWVPARQCQAQAAATATAIAPAMPSGWAWVTSADARAAAIQAATSSAK